jgi:hypothetical protein
LISERLRFSTPVTVKFGARVTGTSCPAGDVTLTANTTPYSSMKNLAPRKINGLGYAKTDLVWQLNGYTQLM